MVSTGIYHKHNYLKYMIFKAIHNMWTDNELTISSEIGKRIGVETEKVTNRLYFYHKYGYVQRLPKTSKEHNGAYRYKLKLLGLRTLIMLENRFQMKYEMNLRNPTPQPIDSYTGHNQHHKEDDE